MPPHILDLTEAQLRDALSAHGARPFVARQILEWVHAKQCLDPTSFSNVSAELRTWLASAFDWSLPAIARRVPAADGSERCLLQLPDGATVEMVIMPSAERVTLCVSSQVGCKMACAFCATGGLGFRRHLSAAEILGQVILANQLLGERRVTNVVFMGMGEPLDNLDATLHAGRVLIEGFGLSRHRVTISTVGVVPGIRRMAAEFPMRLAVSLHAATDGLRSELIPVNQRWPLADLKQALLDYPRDRNGITFEYILLRGINDSLRHAKELVRFVHGLKAKVNLIPFNSHPGSAFAPSEREDIERFQAYLAARSIPAPVRYSRGGDASAACGQLVGQG